MRRTLSLLVLLGVVLACDVKVPISDVGAAFELADATWFEEEQTLFVFYRVSAVQGIGPETRIELAYRTDEVEQAFAPLEDFTPVHTHLPVDCGAYARCGSLSLHVEELPRDVRLRMRYHKDGELFLDAPLSFNVVGAGPAHSHRSLLVYGVFDEANGRVQWRARHRFPAVRNEEAEALGLRRWFQVDGAAYGEVPASFGEENPYGYAVAAGCPASFTWLDWPARETEDRAMFEEEALPLDASPFPGVCALSTVTDALGTFEAVVIARKNPETQPAFPRLRSPIRENRQVKLFLDTCGQEISPPHRALQEQRLLLEGAPVICIDGFTAPGFADQLASIFRERVDNVREQGDDMVLLLSVHHDDRTGQLAAVLEEALEQLMRVERSKSSPRVSGVFLYDSRAHRITNPDLRREVLWCPSSVGGDDLEQIPNAAERNCAPQLQPIELGPLSLASLPILPTRAQYETFIERYSEAQAGRVLSLEIRAPERTPVSTNVPVGDFAVATFFNDELLTATPTEAFSYCAPTEEAPAPAVFRVPGFPDPLPLNTLPQAHTMFPQTTYELGLFWDFPYLLRIEYESVQAVAVRTDVLVVPFGIASSAEVYWGAPQWDKGEFPLADELTRCTRFCEHPTFDSAGVYNVLQPFRGTYDVACYRPRFPALGDGGFPRDP